MKHRYFLLASLLALFASFEAIAKCGSADLSITVSTLTSTGEPAAAIDVTLEWLPEDAEPELVHAKSGKDGSFTFNYRLEYVIRKKHRFGGYSCQKPVGHFQACATFSGQEPVCRQLSPLPHQAVQLSARSGG